MLHVYFTPTPNARKVSILLEELSLSYTPHSIDIMAGDQFTPEYLAICPNNKIPAIVDTDGPDGWPISVWESGAILIYLAEKHGRLIPADARTRMECLKWLMFQVAGVGPMGGQHAFFSAYAREKIPMAIERYRSELNRQMRVMDGHLENHAFFAGQEYSIADIAIYPWWVPISKYADASYPNLERWASTLAARPEVARGMTLLDEALRPEAIQAGMKVAMSDGVYNNLYGESQYVADRPVATGAPGPETHA